MDRHLTGDLKPVNKGVRAFIEKSQAARVFLKLLGVLGVSMVMRSVNVIYALVYLYSPFIVTEYSLPLNLF